VLDGARETGTDFGHIAIADGLDQEVAQRPPLELEFAKHVEDLMPTEIPANVYDWQTTPVSTAAVRAKTNETRVTTFP